MILDLSRDFPQLQYSTPMHEGQAYRIALSPDSLLSAVLEYIYDHHVVNQFAASPKNIIPLEKFAPENRCDDFKVSSEFWERVKILVPKLKVYRERLMLQQMDKTFRTMALQWEQPRMNVTSHVVSAAAVNVGSIAASSDEVSVF